MKALADVMKLNRRLKNQAQRLGLRYECRVVITDYSEACVQNEDGKVFEYPETISVNIESWETFKMDVRVSDGRWIREGRSMNGIGMSTAQLYRRVLENLKAHAETINKGKAV